MIKGLFLSDIHLPWNIDLAGIFKYASDFNPDYIILGGDIIDAAGMFGVDGWSMQQVENQGYAHYDRDVKLLKDLIVELDKHVNKPKYVYLEGNHEERYQRLIRKYPNTLKGRFKFERDAVPDKIKRRFKWIPYGDYTSFFKIGDTLFTHGTIYPDAHAKKMALAYLPAKTVYGHIHDFQAYTAHSGDPRKPGRYAITGGCLCNKFPDYKKGHPHKWVNGFIDFVSIKGITTPTAHIIERGQFAIGGKLYGITASTY